MTRADVAAAVARAAELAEAWRRAVGPGPGAPWDTARSRQLEAADDALARLQALAMDLGAP